MISSLFLFPSLLCIFFVFSLTFPSLSSSPSPSSPSVCPSPCENGGQCIESKCLCTNDFIGPTCSLPLPSPPLCYSAVLSTGISHELCLNLMVGGNPQKTPTTPNDDSSYLYFRIQSSCVGWIGLLFDPHTDGMTNSFGYAFHVESPIFSRESQLTPMMGLGHAMPQLQLHSPIPSMNAFYLNSSVDLTWWRPLVSQSPPGGPFDFDFSKWANDGTTLGMSFAFGPEENMTLHCAQCKRECNVNLRDMNIQLAPLPDYFLWYGYPIGGGVIAFLLLFGGFIGGNQNSPIWKFIYHHRLIESTSVPFQSLSSHRGNSYPFLWRLFDLLTFDFRFHLRDLLICEFIGILIYICTVLSFIYLSFNNLIAFPNRTYWPLFGHLLLWNLPLIFIFPTRKSVLWGAFHLPFDRIIKYHRWIVRMVIVFCLIHLLTELHNYGVKILFYKVGYYLEKGSIYGFYTFISICIVTAFSWEGIRRFSYEIFLFIHFLGVPAIVVLASLHAKAAWVALIGPVGLWAIDVLYRLYLIILPFPIVSAEVQSFPIGDVKLSDGTNSLDEIHVTRLEIHVGTEDGILSPARHILPSKGPSADNSEEGVPTFGHFYSLNIPSSSWIQFHPLSLSCSSAYARETGNLVFHVLSVDDPMSKLTGGWISTWTQGVEKAARKVFGGIPRNTQRTTNGGVFGNDGHIMRNPLLEDEENATLTKDKSSLPLSPLSSSPSKSSSSHGLSARLHGPYGALSINPSSYRHLVFIAGGIGLTPWIPFFDEYSHRAMNSQSLQIPFDSIHVVYSSRSSSLFNFLMGPSISHLMQIDGFREKLHLHLFCSNSLKGKSKGGDGGKLLDEEDDDLNASVGSVGEENSLNSSMGGHSNGVSSQFLNRRRLDIPHLLAEISSSVSEENHRNRRPLININEIGVFVCGPDSMVNETQKFIEEHHGEARDRWGFHKELFKY